MELAKVCLYLVLFNTVIIIYGIKFATPGFYILKYINLFRFI